MISGLTKENKYYPGYTLLSPFPFNDRVCHWIKIDNMRLGDQKDVLFMIRVS